MNILVINGPNINMLGLREPHIYGHQTYEDLKDYIFAIGDDLGVNIDIFQSNYEGDIVTKIQEAYRTYDGIVINPAAYTHTSIAILDALKSVGLACVEVHLSDISTREDFRQVSYVSYYAKKTITGLGFEGYKEAIYYLVSYPDS